MLIFIAHCTLNIFRHIAKKRKKEKKEKKKKKKEIMGVSSYTEVDPDISIRGGRGTFFSLFLFKEKKIGFQNNLFLEKAKDTEA